MVDDHRSFADLLVLALSAAGGMSCVGTARTADEAVAAALRLRPDVVIMDIRLGTDDGLIATQRVRAVLPDTLVAVVTAHCDPSWISRAAQAGASAFIPKDSSLQEMLDILRRMAPGQLAVAPAAWDRLEPRSDRAQGVAGLTGREVDVLARLGQGFSVKLAARALGISVHTCRGYVKSLHAKMGVSSQLELVIKAQTLGLLTVELPVTG